MTVAFKPAVAIPKKVTPKILTKYEFANMKFENYVNERFNNAIIDDEKFDICASLRKRKSLNLAKETKISKRKRTK